MIEQVFITFSAEKLEQLRSRIQDCLGKLTYEQIWMRNSDNENAVGNLVLHLCGNVGQWIGSGVARRPDTRQRDTEFAARNGSPAGELSAKLAAVVSDAAAVIRSLTPEKLTERRSIQKYDVTVFEAVYHVVEHFAQHTGQIQFATKLMTGADLGYYRHLAQKAHAEKVP